MSGFSQDYLTYFSQHPSEPGITASNPQMRIPRLTQIKTVTNGHIMIYGIN